jgi:hypothetical protein
MAIIPIKSRPDKHILMDDEVADVIGCWNWNLSSHGYARAYLPKSGKKNRKNVLCHRAVIWAVTGQWPAKGMEIDHLNHNKLDNKIANLRVINTSINQRNRKKQDGASQYKGVGFYKHRPKKPWFGRTHLLINGKDIMIYGLTTSDEAIAGMARDCLCDLIGGFLLPNFPHMTFKEKWQLIGEGQRNQILYSLTKNGITPKEVE